MKERKTVTKKEETSTKQIRTDAETYFATEDKAAAFAGINKYGLYIGLNVDGEKTDFISGYEALSFLNQLLNEFNNIAVQYSKEISKNNKEYEGISITNYEM